MLVEFKVANYLSFKEPVTFSLVAAKIKSPEKRLNFHNVVQIDGELSLLKSAAIWGANGSGKSNLAAAIRFMRWFVLNSAREPRVTEAIPCGCPPLHAAARFRLSAETEGKPCFFEMIFIADKKIYRYGFALDAQQVVSEWLFYVPGDKEVNLFERESGRLELIDGLPSREIGKKVLFLSVLAESNVEFARKIWNWFENFTVVVPDDRLRDFAVECLESNQYREAIVRFLKKLDPSINKIEVGGETPVKTVKILRQKYDAEGQPDSFEEFNLEEESEGMQKLFDLSGVLVDALKTEKVILIDDFDAHLHPLVSRAIANLFNSNETNPRPAQLIFTAGSTHLLSHQIFRKDQIWFAEKNKQGATELFSLVEYKIRNDTSFESDYLGGKYGAVPDIGNWRSWMGELDE